MPRPYRRYRKRRSRNNSSEQPSWSPSVRFPTRESYLSHRATKNRNSGAEGEHSLALDLSQMGFKNATRGTNKDIIHTQPFHIECKNVRSALILKWMWQAIRDCVRFKQLGYTIPTVWMKHGDDWYVMVPASHLRSFCNNMLKKMRGK